ncbi:Intercellular signal essential for a variety of patterning events during development (By similarity) [Seminavis robusta]|uniref:Intercellular signal essential for a variety of patterning events during development By similarity n=1 Tax=Seminavis robusta TaxID=568900 RepID=A0A9N8DFF2_9STRA|nr:Intercellular signal essential for a variety of patterning events during development (By similarity) [Seminavis robusta]|eukprot:Sro99_g050750.1 Intercellular signal essential for a variety of patterning events during development (By similarity) (601) ;mRNA; f:19471-21273
MRAQHSFQALFRLLIVCRCCVLPACALWFNFLRDQDEAPSPSPSPAGTPSPCSTLWCKLFRGGEDETPSPTPSPTSSPSPSSRLLLNIFAGQDETSSPSPSPTGTPSPTPLPLATSSPTESKADQGDDEKTSTESPTASASLRGTFASTDTATQTLSTETGTPTELYTTAPTQEEDDAFYTIIVLSDVENNWRGHNIARSRYIVQYIRDLSKLDLYFEGDFSDHKIDPQLVINTGDISHFWSCHNPNYLYSFTGNPACRSPHEEFRDIWGQLYKAGIPMISSYGNHDWRPRIGTGNPYRGTPRRPRDPEADNINLWSSEFVQMSYELAAAWGDLTFKQIPPVGDIGQSMYTSNFRGLQIASFNSAPNWQSYDDRGIYSADEQFRRLSETLNRTQPTLFFSHFPLSSNRLGNQTPSAETVVKFIQQFPAGTHHFAGHYHAASIERYNGFNSYIVPYPHTWVGREPGYLALLVSKLKNKVVQVQAMTIPGLQDGTLCYLPGGVNFAMNIRYYMSPQSGILWRPWGEHFGNLFGGARSDNDAEASNEEEDGCDRCKAGKQYWSPSRLGWICGDPPSEANIFETDRNQDIYDSLDGSDFADDQF